jgi:hypothetical protein
MTTVVVSLPPPAVPAHLTPLVQQNLTTGDSWAPIEILGTVSNDDAQYLATGDGSELQTGDGSELQTGTGSTSSPTLWLEALTTAESDAEAPVEEISTTTPSVGGNQWLQAEGLENLVADGRPPGEIETTAGKDLLPPIEASANLLGDGFPPIEDLATGVSDRWASVSAGASQASDEPSPAEALGTAPVDSPAPAESGESVTLDRTAPLESSEMVMRDAYPPAESLGSWIANAAGPVELLLLARADGGALEVLGRVLLDSWPATEGQGAAVHIAEAATPIESLGTDVVDPGVPGEATALSGSDRLAAIEALLAARSDGAPVEFGLLVRIDPPSPSESVSDLTLDRSLPNEATALSGGDQNIPAEVLETTAQDQPAPIEQSAAGAALFPPIEYAAAFSPVGSMIVGEMAALSQSAGVPAAETLAAYVTQADFWLPFGFATSPPPLPVVFVTRARLRQASPSLAQLRAFAPIGPGESDNFAFDFTSEVGGAAISTVAWSCALRPFQAAVDLAPQSHVLSVAAPGTQVATEAPAYLDLPATAVVVMAGAFAIAKVGAFTAAEAGALYNLAATVVTSDGRTLQLDADLPVRASFS